MNVSVAYRKQPINMIAIRNGRSINRRRSAVSRGSGYNLPTNVVIIIIISIDYDDPNYSNK